MQILIPFLGSLGDINTDISQLLEKRIWTRKLVY